MRLTAIVLAILQFVIFISVLLTPFYLKHASIKKEQDEKYYSTEKVLKTTPANTEVTTETASSEASSNFTDPNMIESSTEKLFEKVSTTKCDLVKTTAADIDKTTETASAIELTTDIPNESQTIESSSVASSSTTQDPTNPCPFECSVPENCQIIVGNEPVAPVKGKQYGTITASQQFKINIGVDFPTNAAYGQYNMVHLRALKKEHYFKYT